jgi:acyl phosphate:glycerol-3-phosphate acyltransferase
MNISFIPSLLSIVIAYLLGSISSSWVVGRLFGNLDMSTERDGRISASALHDKLGLLPYAIVVFMDIGLALSAVIVARMFTNNINIMMLSGLAAVAGHNWSIFLKFKGGLGATAILGALALVISWPIFYGLAVAGMVLVLTHKPGLSTAVGIFTFSCTVLIEKGPGVEALYPLTLFILMLIKRIQVARAVKTTH